MSEIEIELEEEDYKFIVEEAKKSGISLDDFVSKVIREYLDYLDGNEDEENRAKG